jgi:hypothetical protein
MHIPDMRLQRRVICPDGQFAHGRHAQIARRVILSQADGIAENPKSAISSPPSRSS